MNFEITEEKKALVQNVIKKALKDESYKERLIKSPKEAIRELHPDFEVGDQKEMEFVDQSDINKYHINISYLSYMLWGGDIEEMELSEAELEMVAGGVSCIAVSCIGDSSFSKSE